MSTSSNETSKGAPISKSSSSTTTSSSTISSSTSFNQTRPSLTSTSRRPSSSSSLLKVPTPHSRLSEMSEDQSHRQRQRFQRSNTDDPRLRSHSIMDNLRISTPQLEELAEIFHVIDQDKGGTVSMDELGSLIRLVTPTASDDFVSHLMRQADTNEDGEINFEEFVNLVAEPILDEDERGSTIRQAFDVFDTDHDGYITATELGRIMTRIGCKVTDEEISDILSEADQDGDGKVTFEEFKAMISRDS